MFFDFVRIANYQIHVFSHWKNEQGIAEDDYQNSVSDNERTSGIYEHSTNNEISKETAANDFETAANFKEIQSMGIKLQGEKNPEKKSSREKLNDVLENRRNKKLIKKLSEQKRNEHID